MVSSGPRWWWCEQLWGRPACGPPRNTGGESEGKVGADTGQSGSCLGGKNTIENIARGFRERKRCKCRKIEGKIIALITNVRR